MEGLILAAGEGSRLGDHARGIPKVFIDLHGRSLYERHLDAIADMCDRVSVVLGYGFVGDVEAMSAPPPRDGSFEGDIRVHAPAGEETETTVHEQRIRAYLAHDHDIDVTAIVLPHWARMDNAGSCRAGLADVDDDVLLLNGDVVCRDGVVRTIVDEYRTRIQGRDESLVAVKPGIQDEMTAVRWDKQGQIEAYGAIAGHQVAGIFVINAAQIREVRSYLETRQSEWFPVAFPAIDSTFVPIPPDSQFEINTPEQLDRARSGVTDWERKHRASVP